MHQDSKYTETAREILSRPTAFAILPTNQLDHGLTEGALILLCIMRAWLRMFPADKSAGIVRTPRGGWHGIIGCHQSSVPRWCDQLTRRGFIDKHKNRYWRIVAANVADRKYIKVPLAPLLKPDVSRRGKRAWIELHRYVDHKDGRQCFPTLATLARNLGRALSNVKRALRDLVTAGYLQRIWKMGVRISVLYPSGDALKKARQFLKRTMSGQAHSDKVAAAPEKRSRHVRGPPAKAITGNKHLDEQIRQLGALKSMDNA